MLTRNWYKILYGMLKGSAAYTSQGHPYTNSGTYKAIKIIDFSGNQCTQDYSFSLAYVAYLSPIAYRYDKQIYKSLVQLPMASNRKWGIILGSGTTAPTIDDFKMVSPITTGLSLLSATGTTTSDDKGSKFIGKYSIQNTSTDPITIAEIGYTIDPDESQSNLTKIVLMDRTLLETPITIEAGGIGNIEYSIEFINPFEVDS